MLRAWEDSRERGAQDPSAGRCSSVGRLLSSMIGVPLTLRHMPIVPILRRRLERALAASRPTQPHAVRPLILEDPFEMVLHLPLHASRA
jgi:hypothetical protein